ncbi:MAG: putative immunity protein [Planctomycetota bacterium]
MMDKLTLEKLQGLGACSEEGLGACSEAMAIYKTRQESDPEKAITLLIGGCDELTNTGERTRLRWASWLIVRLLSYKDTVRYAAFAAEQVIGLFEERCPDDKRPRQAIEMTKEWLDGRASKAEARFAADAAARAAYAAADAAADAAAGAAGAAARAAYAAADDYSMMLARILRYGLTLLKG